MTASPPFYDSLILAAAHDAGCRVVDSGDRQNGQRFAGLAVRNPF